MESDRIERQYNDSKELFEYLMGKGEVSFATYINNVYKKVLVLSAASYCESAISGLILQFANEVSSKDKRVVKLIESKVIERQYHTLFDWNSKNTNTFWKLFGEDTKTKARNKIDNDEVLKQSEQSFISMGQLRNLLVHENFAEYDVNLTVEEIYSKYRSACTFVSFISTVLSLDFLKAP